MTLASCDSRKTAGENPFFTEWDTPHGVPPFDKILPEHFMPAFERGMSLHEAEIDAITSNKDEATFENTILAYDNAGQMLAQAELVFGMLCEELGLIVALCAMLAIIALAIFTVKNAAQGRSSYYVIAGCATVTLMLVQMSLNVFGVLDILPFTGVTFPFVSKGGSSMLSCWMLLAYIKAADTRRGASFVVRLPSRSKKEAQA